MENDPTKKSNGQPDPFGWNKDEASGLEQEEKNTENNSEESGEKIRGDVYEMRVNGRKIYFDGGSGCVAFKNSVGDIEAYMDDMISIGASVDLYNFQRIS